MKTLDGSLTIFDDGSEVFTPYNHNPKKNSPWVNLSVCNGVTISATKNIVKLHLTFKRKPFHLLASTILSLVKNALVVLKTPANKKRYDEMMKAAETLNDDNDEVLQGENEQSEELPSSAEKKGEGDFNPSTDCFAY